jgi:Cof subfamily protein (haloacid dehalogenase superfamily)
MGYKLICVDMDGTLLNSRKQISERNKSVLRQAREQGVRIAISTGRTYVDARYYVDLIGLEIPIIAANGAYIQVEKQQQPIYQSRLDTDLAVRILDTCRRYRITPSFHTPQKEYYGNGLLLLRWLLFGVKHNLSGNCKWVWGYKNWRRVLAEEQGLIVKCVIIGLNQKKLQRLRVEFSRNDALEVVSSWSNNIELNCKGISKGKGVELLAEYYNIKKEEIIAIGDSENDLTMLEYAGLGVAMGNAAPGIKERADFVTDTNDRDGVARVIEKFFLNPQRH